VEEEEEELLLLDPPHPATVSIAIATTRTKSLRMEHSPLKIGNGLAGPASAIAYAQIGPKVQAVSQVSPTFPVVEGLQRTSGRIS
jgi:hypothetical protein